MANETAGIRLRIDGLDEVLAQLRQLQSAVSGIQLPGNTGLPAGSTTTPAPAPSIPTPIQPPPAPSTPPPSPPNPGAPSLIQALAGLGMGASYWNTVNTFGGAAGAAAFNNALPASAPIYSSILSTVFGTIGGAAAGPFGTVAGLGIASAVSSFAGPAWERADHLRELGVLMRRAGMPDAGYVTDPGTPWERSIMAPGYAGLPGGLIADVTERAYGGVMFNPAAVGRFGGMPATMGRAGFRTYAGMRMSSAMIAELGADPLKDSPAAFDEVLENGKYADPLGAMFLRRAMGRSTADVERLIARRAELEFAGPESAARLGLAMTGAQVAQRRFGAMGGAAAFVSDVEPAMRGRLRTLDATIADITEPRARAAATMQRNATAAQFSLLQEEFLFGAPEAESAAMFGFASSSAQRAFQAELYGGATAGSLPWEQQIRLARSRASDLTGEMERRRSAGFLPPALAAQFRDQIEAQNFAANIGIPRSREQSMNSEMMASAALTFARTQADSIPGIMRGSAAESFRAFDVEIGGMQARLSVLKEILETSRFLTHEERIRLQTEQESTRLAIGRAQVQRDVAAAQGTYQVSAFQAGASTQAMTLGLIAGAGGAEITRLQGLGAAGIASTLGAARTMRQDLLNAGFSETSSEVISASQNVRQLEIQQAQFARSRATIPMSPEARIRLSNAQTSYAIMQSGYGSWGDMRGALRGQIEDLGNYLKELSQNRSSLQSAGEWTRAMEADYVESSNAVRLQAAQLAVQHDQGFEDRLISAAYNMPSQGRLFMAGFSRREAAMAGVFHPGFGGSSDQMGYARQMYPRLIRSMGLGDSSALGDRMAGIAAGMPGSLKIEIEVKDARTGAPLRYNASQTNNHKTAAQVVDNSSAERTPAP